MNKETIKQTINKIYYWILILTIILLGTVAIYSELRPVEITPKDLSSIYTVVVVEAILICAILAGQAKKDISKKDNRQEQIK
jgi:uncharacterized membrane protein